MINTYNESPLHHTLKTLYALEYNGKTEIPVSNFICDIVTEDGEIIEIQTSNVSKLKEKVSSLLQLGKKVRIVHTIESEKTIVLCKEDGSIISTRKSPKCKTIYSLPRELTGIYTLLGHKNLTLEILFISIKEIRLKTEEKTQLKNKSRRHLKDWIPRGKRLNSILAKKRFNKKDDFLPLIPSSTPQPFTVSTLFQHIENLPEIQNLSASNKKRTSKEVRLLIWLLLKMNLIKECGKSGRSKTYSII